MKYKLEIAYDGTSYIGWQRQPNGLSVQQVIEEKLTYLYNHQQVSIKGAGRTDAGVHALGMTASFAPPMKPFISNEKLHKAMNNILPKSIYIKNVQIVDPEFDARFSAVGKAYTYVICKAISPGPFLFNWCYHINNDLNIDDMRQAAKYFLGKHDFTSFVTKLNKTQKNPVRKIDRIDIDEIDNFICVTFIGKSFLYRMVRNMMGILIDVARGNMNLQKVKEILEARDCSKVYRTAPAHGLFLMKVFYDKETLNKFCLRSLPFNNNFHLDP